MREAAGGVHPAWRVRLYCLAWEAWRRPGEGPRGLTTLLPGPPLCSPAAAPVGPKQASRLDLHSPILKPEEMEAIKAMSFRGWETKASWVAPHHLSTT